MFCNLQTKIVRLNYDNNNFFKFCCVLGLILSILFVYIFVLVVVFM